jgi:hypothetical protein
MVLDGRTEAQALAGPWHARRFVHPPRPAHLAPVEPVLDVGEQYGEPAIDEIGPREADREPPVALGAADRPRQVGEQGRGQRLVGEHPGRAGGVLRRVALGDPLGVVAPRRQRLAAAPGDDEARIGPRGADGGKMRRARRSAASAFGP